MSSFWMFPCLGIFSLYVCLIFSCNLYFPQTLASWICVVKYKFSVNGGMLLSILYWLKKGETEKPHTHLSSSETKTRRSSPVYVQLLLQLQGWAVHSSSRWRWQKQQGWPSTTPLGLTGTCLLLWLYFHHCSVSREIWKINVRYCKLIFRIFAGFQKQEPQTCKWWVRAFQCAAVHMESAEISGNSQALSSLVNEAHYLR